MEGEKEGKEGKGRKKLHSLFGVVQNILTRYLLNSRLHGRSGIACLKYVTFTPDYLLSVLQ